ncbi:MAG: hypothetical protein KAJ48_07170, partial [Elusimicrobiales bacterium]|nr:hypothetical protein [Elusimicrobiales bacterium]
MIKKIALLSTMLFFFCSSSAKARENFNLNSLNAGDIGRFDGHSPRLPAKVVVADHPLHPKPEVRPQPEQEWTIMIYVNAKNDLEKFGLNDINEMEIIGSSDKVNIVVELGRMNGFDSSDDNWTGTRRYLIKKDNNNKAITSPVIAELGKVDMGDWKHLVDFGAWAKTNYPAKKYMLIVWNHGTGWEKGVKSMKNKGLSYDFETK